MNALQEYIKSHSVEELHSSEIANLLKDMDDKSFQEAVAFIPQDLVADVALELPDRYFEDVVELLTSEELAESVSDLESDDQKEFIEELEEVDEQKAKEVFGHLDQEDQEDIEQLRQYEDKEAGSHMQVELYAARLEHKVRDVIEEFAGLRRSGELENINYLFVVDSENKLEFGVGLDSLLTFDFDGTLAENILRGKDSYLPVVGYDHESIDEIVKKFQEYDLSSMPIIDSEGILVGRITSDDIYDLISEQATDQMYHMAGVNDEAEEDDNLWEAGKTRAAWLGVNLITAIMASLVIGIFSSELQSYVPLAILMPIVASMGGNAGTQSLTVVVRQMALGEIAKNDAYRTIKKEVILSLANGFLFAGLVGVIASVWFNNSMLGIVIALSMVINLLSAGFFGSMIPLLLKRINVDPAVGSSVILTTVTDVVGFLSFLTLASVLLLKG